jgi:hypothetical protein
MVCGRINWLSRCHHGLGSLERHRLSADDGCVWVLLYQFSGSNSGFGTIWMRFLSPGVAVLVRNDSRCHCALVLLKLLSMLGVLPVLPIPRICMVYFKG